MSRRAIIYGLLLTTVLISFSPLLHADFTILDDPTTIQFNPAFNPPTLSSLGPIWTEAGRRAPLGLYVPATYTVWWLIAHLAYSPIADDAGSHLNPWVFHAVNVMLHGLAVLLVFELLNKLLHARWPAFGAALIFAVHPLQVEAVAWASGTKDLLCGTLSIAAMLLYLQAAQRCKCRWLYRWLTSLLVLLAMLAKPTAIITPLMIGIIDATFLRRSWRATLSDLWPSLAWMPLCAAWAHAAQPAEYVAAAPVWARPILAADSLWFYAHKLLMPINLAVDYGRKPLYILGLPTIWSNAAAATLLFGGLMFRFRRKPRQLAGVSLFIVGLLPVLGFLPFTFQTYSSVADHYVYLPMLGVALLTARTLQRLANVTIFSLVTLLLAALSLIQSTNWQRELDLWPHCLAVNPNSLLARINYGAALYRAQHYDAAEHEFSAAAELEPDDLDAQDNLALVMLATGRPAEAIEHLQRELQLAAALPAARRQLLDGPYVLLARAYRALGQPERAADAARSAMSENPNSRDALQLLRALPPSATPATLPF